jgi:XTP/dITP diphosphohydrolase
MRKIVLASKNRGKIAELERLLSKFVSDVKVLGLTDFPNMPEVIESGNSLSENAWLKAKQISVFSNLPTLADDSGLFIDALAGKPGIYSSRWSGYEGDDWVQRDRLNIEKTLTELAGVPVGKRGAQFKTVVAFYKPNTDGSFFEQETVGVLTGQISQVAVGEFGFGYDPIFIPDGFKETLAQLPAGVKDEVSHRGKALGAIAPFLLDHL